MSPYEFATICLQVIIIIAALATFRIYYKQFRVMREQLNTMRESTLAQNALSLANYLQTPDVRSARKCVRSKLSTTKQVSIFFIPITNQIFGSFIIKQQIPYLLDGPFGGRIFSNIEMN